jgi:adenosine deaminase
LLSNERRVLTDELGFNEHDLDELDYVSVHAAFVEDATREHFVSRLNRSRT